MNKLFKYLLLFLILALNLSCAEKKSSKNEISKLEFENFSNADTLNYNCGIRAIFQDSKGNYWFGSHQEGVCLFDGKTFTYFTSDDGLSDNQVRTIQEDQNGIIWFVTGNGVSSYDGKKIINHTLKSNTITGYFSQNEWVKTDRDLWFGAGINPGVYRWDGHKLSYLKFPVKKTINPDNVYLVTGITNGKNEMLWISTYTGIFGYNGKKFTIINDETLNLTKKLGLLHIRSIFEDSKGRLWIGNNGIGVLLKEGDSIINFSEQNHLIHPTSSRSGDKSPAGTLEHVFVINEDAEGNIWFGDRDTGAWKFDGKAITNYIIDDKLATPMIWSIYNDNKNNLLFGMADGGIYKFNGKSFDRIF